MSNLCCRVKFGRHSLSSQRPSFVSKLTVGSVVAMDSGPMEMSRDPENVNEFDDLEE